MPPRVFRKAKEKPKPTAISVPEVVPEEAKVSRPPSPPTLPKEEPVIPPTKPATVPVEIYARAVIETSGCTRPATSLQAVRESKPHASLRLYGTLLRVTCYDEKNSDYHVTFDVDLKRTDEHEVKAVGGSMITDQFVWPFNTSALIKPTGEIQVGDTNNTWWLQWFTIPKELRRT